MAVIRLSHWTSSVSLNKSQRVISAGAFDTIQKVIRSENISNSKWNELKRNGLGISSQVSLLIQMENRVQWFVVSKMCFNFWDGTFVPMIWKFWIASTKLLRDVCIGIDVSALACEFLTFVGYKYKSWALCIYATVWTSKTNSLVFPKIH